MKKHLRKLSIFLAVLLGALACAGPASAAPTESTQVGTIKGRALLLSDVKPGADLTEAVFFPTADLSGRDMQRINFSGACLQQVRMRRANLREAKFELANLKEANLFRADLTGASLSCSWAEGANFGQAIVDGVDWTDADLTDSVHEWGICRFIRVASSALQERLVAGFSGAPDWNSRKPRKQSTASHRAGDDDDDPSVLRGSTQPVNGTGVDQVVKASAFTAAQVEQFAARRDDRVADPSAAAAEEAELSTAPLVDQMAGSTNIDNPKVGDREARSSSASLVSPSGENSPDQVFQAALDALGSRSNIVQTPLGYTPGVELSPLDV